MSKPKTPYPERYLLTLEDVGIIIAYMYNSSQMKDDWIDSYNYWRKRPDDDPIRLQMMAQWAGIIETRRIIEAYAE